MKSVQTIDQVIATLDEIIATSKVENSPLGYFAALYRKVTLKVKEGIKADFFDDGPRMEKLDVIFARQYIEAYDAFREERPVMASWQKSFDYSPKYWPIVLQHLLLSMNPHINMDLAIAAAEVSRGSDIEALHDDFNRINMVLSGLVDDVQRDLTEVWPALRWILKVTGRMSDRLTDFSMKIARDGAWKFAKFLTDTPEDQWAAVIEGRDEKVAKISRLITHPVLFIRLLFTVIRLGERGTVSKRIQHLED